MNINAIHSVRPRNSHHYDIVYLNQMIIGHTPALKFTATVIDTAQNPVLTQFALNFGPTIWMQRLAAQAILRRLFC